VHPLLNLLAVSGHFYVRRSVAQIVATLEQFLQSIHKFLFQLYALRQWPHEFILRAATHASPKITSSHLQKQYTPDGILLFTVTPLKHSVSPHLHKPVSIMAPVAKRRWFDISFESSDSALSVILAALCGRFIKALFGGGGPPRLVTKHSGCISRLEICRAVNCMRILRKYGLLW
jgi:hypothetical protein